MRKQSAYPFVKHAAHSPSTSGAPDGSACALRGGGGGLAVYPGGVFGPWADAPGGRAVNTTARVGGALSLIILFEPLPDVRGFGAAVTILVSRRTRRASGLIAALLLRV